MKINEVEKLLGIPKATIRYYEDEDLLKPSRTDSGYRDYDAQDIEDLKKIIVLRKAGVSVTSIREILNGKLTLQDAARKSLVDLQSKMEELSGSISLCDEIANSDYTLDKMDVDSIIDRIRIEESKGVRFLSIANELIDYEAQTMRINIGEKDESFSKKLRNLVLYVLSVAFICGLSWKMFRWGPFWENFLSVIAVYLALLVIFEIVFFIGRKNARAGEIALKTVGIIAAIILAFVILFLIAILFNSRLHFWY